MELQAKLDKKKIELGANRKDRNALVGVALDLVEEIAALEKQIAALEKQIAAEAKPELRDEDYGYDKDGEPTIVLRSGDDTMYYQPVSSSYDPKCKPVVIVGNLADDLKAMQEPVTEFKQPCRCLGGIDDLLIYCEPKLDRVVFHIGGRNTVIDKENYPAFEMFIRQAGATLKRNK